MLKSYLLSIFSLLFILQGFAQKNPNSDPVYKEFISPPNAAKPRVWWHWMNGNITQEGIRKDLDWMEKTGIGGFQNFDANLFTPVIVKEKLVFMTPAWKEAFKYATDLAGQKGLEMAIAGSPGWSVTGGPWVEPKDGMKKYVWAETDIEGGKEFKGKLNQPSDVTGKFQDVGIEEGGALMGGFIGEKPHFYQDALVVAYPIPDNEVSLESLHPKITVSGGDVETNKLMDGKLHETVFLPPMEVGEDMWVQYAFDQPQTFQSMGVAGASFTALSEFNGVPLNRSLKVSNDGVTFKTIAQLSGSNVPFNTVAFEPTSAKFWRMCFETLPPTPNLFAAMAGNTEEPKAEGVNIAEFQLFTSPRIDQIEDKAGFSPWTENGELAGNLLSNSKIKAISQDQVIDLIGKMAEDGTLTWDVPEGNWKVIRFGYSLTGRQNHPASPEATGLEVDKLDPDAVKTYINHYLDLYQDATGDKLGDGGLGFMILDSYEAGHMNWTEGFEDEFEKRKGYSLLPYLPVLTGRVVGSLEESEKFLWDFRRTIGELIAENHYDVIGEELKKRGMKRYTESHENKRIYLADGMDVKRNADIPMSAMWTPGSLAGGNDEEVRSEGDIRESASVANIYGKKFIAAESMTSVGKPFQEYPEKLKRTADLEMASGVNRFVIHTSVHQPLDDLKPGFSLGPFGQYFTRQETWADMASAWISYLSRSSYMLQQGRNVADILYLYGENTNITWVTREKLPDIPSGYEFDFVNSTALIEVIQASEGKLLAPSGNSYEALILDESTSLMTLPVLKKLKSLAESGVRIIGEKPVKSPSLSDDEMEFTDLANEIWAMENVGEELEISVDPDVKVSNTDHKILFKHRKTDSKDIYWFNNRSVDPTKAVISVRLSGKLPLKWDPITGKTEAVSYQVKNGRTEIPLDFESWDAFFLVFEGSLSVNSMTIPERKESEVQTLGGNWKVDFGGIEKEFSALVSWPSLEEEKIKYYSGTASYKTNFTFSEKEEEASYELDLGSVKHMAEVILNGQNMGIVWKTPYRLDISSALKSGNNELEVRVVNTWVNRLIGDAQPGAEKSTFTTMPFYQPNSPLMESGLLGPVKLIKIE